MANIQGKDINIKISADGGTTYKDLICEIKSGVSMKRDTNAQPTKCNNATVSRGIGAYEWTVDFDAACDDAPTTAQITYKDMQGYLTAGTKIMVKVDSAGTAFKHEGSAYVTDLKWDATINDVVKFSGTLSGDGALTIA